MDITIYIFTLGLTRRVTFEARFVDFMFPDFGLARHFNIIGFRAFGLARHLCDKNLTRRCPHLGHRGLLQLGVCFHPTFV